MSDFFDDTMQGLLEAIEIEKGSNKTISYPVIFTDVDTNILIEVPDLEILTEANEEGSPKGNISDAVKMARDAIEITLLDKVSNCETIKPPSLLEDIDVSYSTFYEYGKSFVSMVKIDMAKIQENRKI